MGNRIFVEAWDPDFGASFAPGELQSSEAGVDPAVEVPKEKWVPIRPDASPAQRLVFVDGVRRIDALVWITGDDGATRLGLCASYAAGIVRTEGRAEIRNVAVRRGLFTSASLEPLVTIAGIYEPELVPGATAPSISVDLQERLRRLEAEVAAGVSDFDLLILDGPLSEHHRRARAVGYVKSHRVHYLEEALERIVHQLAPGERTPLFLTTTSWRRYSTYLRLEGERTHPWAGIVRLELSAETAFDEVVRIANCASSTLPPYASQPHKDPRAPQNLFPIGGLERELRRRMGDAAFVHRALRLAAAERI